MASGEKVIPMPQAADHRQQTRDDRRIIFEKINEVYVDETTGYSVGWNDERVATDLGVPRSWIVKIRDENFGPEVDEVSTKILEEAKTLLAEIKAAGVTVEPIVRQLQDLAARGERLERAIHEMETRRKH